jgi:hypothetical protein
MALEVVAIGPASSETVVQSGGSLQTPHQGNDVYLIAGIGPAVSVRFGG